MVRIYCFPVHTKLSIRTIHCQLGKSQIYQLETVTWYRKENNEYKHCTDTHWFISNLGPCRSCKTQLVWWVMNANLPDFFWIKLCAYIIITRNTLTLSWSNLYRKKHCNEIHQGHSWSAVEKCGAGKIRTNVLIDDLYQWRWIFLKLDDCRILSKFSLHCFEEQPFSTIKAFRDNFIEFSTDDFVQEPRDLV